MLLHTLYNRFIFVCIFATLVLGSNRLAGKTNRLGKDYALFFPTDQYHHSDWSDLRNPVRDAEAIANELENHYGFETQIYPNVSKNMIRDILWEWQDRQFEEDDQLFVFFSGHGTFNDRENQGYYVPTEGEANGKYNDSHLPLNIIGNMVSKIGCEHILLAIDACFSGTIDQTIAFKSRFVPRRLGDTPAHEQARKIDRLLAHKSRFLLTSGGKERTPDGVNHSPFTEGILDALRFTYSQGDGILSWYDLLGFMQDVHPRPHHGELRGHENGGFVFVCADQADPEIRPVPRSRGMLQSEEAFNEANNCGSIPCLESFLENYKDPYDPFVKAAQNMLNQLQSDPSDPLTGIPLPNMVKVPAGNFLMGSKQGDEDEQAVHRVKISSFYLSNTEITNAQFCAFLNEKGNQIEADYTWLDLQSKSAEIEKRVGKFVPKAGRENYPVVCVSWYGARAYCQWLSELSGQYYRLPTEAEWEYAAGWGPMKRTKWAGTQNPAELREYANIAGTRGKDVYRGTAPVGAFKPNALGLFDMGGNVWEWCADYYDARFYENCLYHNLIQNPINRNKSEKVVLRGGSWNYGEARFFRVANRLKYDPTKRLNGSGFRIAKSIP